MKKLIFGLTIFFGGCICLGQLFIALVISGLNKDIITSIWFSGLTVPFLFSLTLIIYGFIKASKETSEKENVLTPGKQNDKYSD